MVELRGRRPSPALVISITALFIALGGSAWAAHRIGSREIKAGAVTAAKIKGEAVTAAKLANGAVTGPKIAPSSVGGRQVEEASLATVPDADHAATATRAESAARADRASTAANADTASSAVNFRRYASSPLTVASVGQEVTIMNRGPFTFFGHCANGGGGAKEAFVTATTSATGATFSNLEEAHFRADFDPGEENAVGPPIASLDPATNDSGGGDANRFTALSPDGQTRLTGEATAAVNYLGAPCAFWGWTMDGG
jgi:hypothetical protein